VRPSGAFILSTVASAAVFVHAAELDLGPQEVLQSSGSDIVVSGYSVPSMADWNSDGLRDLVVGEGGGGFDGRVRVYLNLGTAASPAFADEIYAQSDGVDLIVTPAGCLGAFPRVVYWDGDDRKDLLVGRGDGTVSLYLNTGTDPAPEFDQGRLLQVGTPGNKIDLSVGGRATPVVVDWDNDGRKDLVVGAADGQLRLYLNEGTHTEPDFVAATLLEAGGTPIVVASFRSSPTVRDVTFDGRKDLVVGNTDGQVLLFANIGSDPAPAFLGAVAVTSAGVPIDLPGSRSRPALCDVDADGIVDLLLGSSDSTVLLYRGTADPFADGFEGGDTTSWAGSVIWNGRG
jgi:hypothetical protein